jgi:hypothetical protein
MFLIHERCGIINIYEIPTGKHYSTMDVGDGLYVIYDGNRLVARYTILNGKLDGLSIEVAGKTTIKNNYKDGVRHGHCIICKKVGSVIREYDHDVLQPGEWFNKKGTIEWVLKGCRETIIKNKQRINYKHTR